MSTLADRAAAFARQALADRCVDGANDSSDAHAASVQGILRYIDASDELLAAGYLYRLVGSASVTLEEIEQEFGAAIAALVRSVVGARRTDPVGGDKLDFEDADVQTLVLAADLATLREAHELMPRVRNAVVDGIRLRAARLLHAHLYVQHEVRQTLVQWEWQWRRSAARSVRAVGVESPGAETKRSSPGGDAGGSLSPSPDAKATRCLHE